MKTRVHVPHHVGQLVWCISDPSLGIGVVTGVEGARVRVRLLRLQEEREYTTRGTEAVIARYEISHNERVHGLDGSERRVVKRTSGPEEPLARYLLDDGQEVIESELVPEVREVGAKERLAALDLVHPEVVRARAHGLRLGALGGRPGHAAVLGARVSFLAHQIDVATRAVASDPVRLLLADEVGLGKTVEAVLIYAGLRQEHRAERVLVLTPRSLTIQWLGEIFRKVHELFVLLDQERIEDAETDFPELGPFQAYHRIVAGLEDVTQRPDLVRAASEAPWDLVIVDEAHHLRWLPESGGNPAYKLVEALARRTRHLLLLTATPMALDPVEYHALLRLLDPTRFDDPKKFAGVAKRVAAIREAGRKLWAAVESQKALPAPAQKQLVDLLDDDPDDARRAKKLVKLTPGSSERRALAQEVLAALRERHGLADYVVRNRRGPVGGLPERAPEIFPLEPTAPQGMLMDVGEDVMLELARTLRDPRERNRVLGELLRTLWATPHALGEILRPISPQLAEQLAPLLAQVTQAPLDSTALPTGDARLRWLVEQIHALAPGDKLLVFVESTVAVRALLGALEQVTGADIAVFYRGLAPRDQDRQVAWFRDPAGARVMLSTEAGGEGRNFQFCHQVVLYDLPWRPATIEQRIGRVDRVGQTRDVRVLVPYFKSGYEAAILKVMHESIGVLGRTVGGIDAVLEFVSDRLAELILSEAKVAAWKDLYRETSELVDKARQRVDNEIDPILDYASFSAERAREVLGRVPADFEAQLEHFVERYAADTRLDIRPKGGSLVWVEGAPGAAGAHESGAGYVATFSRTYALDHEDVEFLSFGHPVVEHALEWAGTAVEASAALAICRGFEKDGAVFLWRFGLDVPHDVPEAVAYFDQHTFTFAVDESGASVPELVSLLETSERPLDRMDPAPLRGSLPRWSRLVETTHEAAEGLAEAAVTEARQRARQRLEQVFTRREQHLARAQTRELALVPARGKERSEVQKRFDAATQALARDKERLTTAIERTMPRLQVGSAVRLTRVKQVSA